MELKKIRTQSFKTQTEVAEGIGISQNTYSNYENEKTSPDIKTLIKLAEYFHTTIDNIVGFENSYLIDRSQFSNIQLEIIDKTKLLSDDACRRVDAYLSGLLVAEEEKRNFFNQINKRLK